MKVLTAPIALLALAGAAAAQPSFELLGTLPGLAIVSEARGVSDDGSTVVGWSGSTFYYGASPHGFHWSHSSGMQDIDPLAPECSAWGISGDGQTIVGLEASTGSTHAYRFTSAGVDSLFHGGEAWAVSRDGSIIAGFEFESSHSSVRHAVRWTAESSHLDTIDIPGVTTFSEALAVSADGSTLVGYATWSGIGTRAFRWTVDGGMENIGSTLPSGATSRANSVSGDGSIIVGSSTIAGVPRAIAWTPTGQIDLGSMIGGATSTALGISADGSTIVGSYGATVTGPQRAFIWRAATGAQDLLSVLGDQVPAGWVLLEARATSANGQFIVGSAAGANVQKEAFLATLPDCVAPMVTTQPLSQSIAAGGQVTLSVNAAGFGPLGYQWQHNGQAIAGATTRVLSLSSVTAADAGEYLCTVSNGCGSTNSDIAVLSLPCYVNCDASTAAPVLNVLDFSCFLNRFAAGDSYANCDQSTTPPVLNVLDFSCFLNQFAAGCQ